MFKRVFNKDNQSFQFGFKTIYISMDLLVLQSGAYKYILKHLIVLQSVSLKNIFPMIISTDIIFRPTIPLLKI